MRSFATIFGLLCCFASSVDIAQAEPPPSRASCVLTGALKDIVIPDNAFCILSDATVNGNVLVGQNAILSVSPSGRTVITGSIEADHCRSLNLTGSVSVGGDVYIHQCAAESGYRGRGIKISGDFHCSNNSGACIADKGWVGGNILIAGNSGKAAADISLNTIAGNLQCQQNAAAPTHDLGPNKVGGTLGDQCGNSFGFGVTQLAASSQLIGPEGGTVTTVNGDQLIVPAGALASPTPVSVRPLTTEETEIALESEDIDAQTLQFLETVAIETGAATFAAPVTLSIPNTTNLPTDAQVIVFQVAPDIDGNFVPDLVLAKPASVARHRIEARALAIPGDGSNIYSFVANQPAIKFLSSSYTFATGHVVTPAGGPVPDAPVANGGAPDFLSQTDAEGRFTATIPKSGGAAAVVSANKAGTRFAVTQVIFPLARPLGRLKLTLPRHTAQTSLDDMECKAPPEPNEELRLKVADAVAEHITEKYRHWLAYGGQIRVLPAEFDLYPREPQIVRPDFAPFLKRVEPGTTISLPFPLQVTNPFGLSSSVAVKSITINSSLQNAVRETCVEMMPSNPRVVSVTPLFLGGCSESVPEFEVALLLPGGAYIEGYFHSFKVSVDLILNTVSTKTGELCAPMHISPEIAVPSTDNDELSNVLMLEAEAHTFGTGIQVFSYSDGAGHGVITSSPPAINCPTGVAEDTCFAYFKGGTKLTLIARPEPGDGFERWVNAGAGPACNGTTLTCTFTVPFATSQDRSIQVIGTFCKDDPKSPPPCPARTFSKVSGSAAAARDQRLSNQRTTVVRHRALQ